MKYKEKLGLGTVQFGLAYGISNERGQVPRSEINSILELAKRRGIKILDSASSYGNAEELLGEQQLDSFKIVSKFIPPQHDERLQKQFEASLANFKVSSLYGYLAHRPLELLKNPSHWQELLDLKSSGKVKKIGFSLNNPEELELLLQKDLVPDLVQAPFNYLDRRFENEFKNLKKIGCEVHSRSTFLQGLFFVEPEKLDPFFDDVKPVIQKLQKNKKKLVGGLLKFSVSREFIDHVIMGVETEAQLNENLQTLEDPIDLPDLQEEISHNILIPSEWPKK